MAVFEFWKLFFGMRLCSINGTRGQALVGAQFDLGTELESGSAAPLAPLARLGRPRRPGHEPGVAALWRIPRGDVERDTTATRSRKGGATALRPGDLDAAVVFHNMSVIKYLKT